jgi:hypothetical protein
MQTAQEKKTGARRRLDSPKPPTSKESVPSHKRMQPRKKLFVVDAENRLKRLVAVL